MTGGNVVYLIGAVSAFLVFAIALAWVSRR